MGGPGFTLHTTSEAPSRAHTGSRLGPPRLKRSLVREVVTASSERPGATSSEDATQMMMGPGRAEPAAPRTHATRSPARRLALASAGALANTGTCHHHQLGSRRRWRPAPRWPCSAPASPNARVRCRAAEMSSAARASE
eukprot:scaffold1643_cov390-Prasinococcus_capsulatus_cf.AAC.14